MLSRVLKRARVALKKLVPKKSMRICTPPGLSTYDDNVIEPDKHDSPPQVSLDGGDMDILANVPEDTTYLGPIPNADDVVHPDVVPPGRSHSPEVSLSFHHIFDQLNALFIISLIHSPSRLVPPSHLQTNHTTLVLLITHIQTRMKTSPLPTPQKNRLRRCLSTISVIASLRCVFH